MKKMIVMAIAILGMSLSTFAADEMPPKGKTVDNSVYDMTTNMRRLAVFLDLDKNQMDAVNIVYGEFRNEMLDAANIEDTDKRDAYVDKVLKKDVRHMRYVLDNEQYHKYLAVLNATLVNRGLLK